MSDPNEPTAAVPETPTAAVPEIPTAAVPEAPPVIEPAKQRQKFGAGMLLAVAGIAIVLGFLGGIVSHSLFPAAAGPTGKQGPAGEQGPTGPTGPAGSASTVDTSNLGYCFNVTYFTDNTGSTSYTWVSGVNLESPTLQSGTQSCPTGTFVPLAASPLPSA